ncbi:class III signal peptide-containing protein [archaeon]|nr:class III signal peptide-containing protein [archaeon]NCP79782.1 class III signal peptide-containing protein [archaeon]NCP98519.1 class III signal peptide-containing protein [archaeon]NCQ07550.1 class III signal peptide-containing protein [archaeon]NCQ50483.1 class III signal peptide-containing protein [archaeon]
MKLRRLIKDNKGQVSLEFIIITGVVILVALTVGIFVKQTSAKNVKTATDYQSIVNNS